MTANRPTGLGEPDLPGKLSLFRPPEKVKTPFKDSKVPNQPSPDSIEISQKRIRTTLDLTWQAFQVVENVQREYRLRTGKVLPLWKAVSQMIEGCGKRSGKKKSGSPAH